MEGLDCASLLVVPHYHDGRRLEEDGELVGWLKKREAEGCEIVLHGHRHALPPPAVERWAGWRTWFLENFYTSREAEFLNLSQSQAVELMGNDLALFQKLGFGVKGFVAPAWLMSAGVVEAARDCGLLYSNSLTGLMDLRHRCFIPARTCVWSVRAGWRRVCSLAWNEVLFRSLCNEKLLRISLHPGDVRHPAVWRQIKRLIGCALSGRKPNTYGGWMAAVQSNQ